MGNFKLQSKQTNVDKRFR